MKRLDSSDAASRRAWWYSWFVVQAIACLAFIYLFARFASEVTEHETGVFDAGVRRWVLEHRSAIALAIFGVITRLGAWYSLIGAALVVAALLVRRGAHVRPLVVAAVPFVLSLIVYSLKMFFQIGRPGVASALTFSFPSGHTSGSTAVAIVIGYVINRERVAPRLGWAVAVSVPILVGVSRVVLDMHWASDVLGGWMVGGAYAAAVCSLYELAYRRAVAS